MRTSFRSIGIFFVIAAFSGITAPHARAAVLPSLGSQSQIDGIASVLASTLKTSPVEPAGGLNRFGAGFGLVLQGALTTQIAALLPSALIAIPFANAYATFYAPLGLSLDVIGFPPINVSGVFSVFNLGGNLKWNFSKVFLDFLPFDLAVQVIGNYGTLGVSQVFNGTTIDVATRSTLFGALGGISKTIGGFFEPYLWLGVLNHSSSLNVTASIPVQFIQFLGSSTSQSAPSSNFNFHGIVGYHLRVGVFAFGMEGSYSFGNIGANLKLGFRI